MNEANQMCRCQPYGKSMFIPPDRAQRERAVSALLVLGIGKVFPALTLGGNRLLYRRRSKTADYFHL